ncbi:MAG: hypothetical protein RLZZ600_1324 [Actinomycetota bacterium]|jgi:hypothetical protein
MNTTVTLVAYLRELSPEQQRELLSLRLSSVTGIKDWFDVADALLRTESLDRGLAALPRQSLASLAEGNISDALLKHLRQLGLADATTVFPEAIARAREVCPAPQLAPDDTVTAVDERRARAALEQAINLVTRIDELLELIAKRGLRTVSRGTLSASDSARITTAITGLPEDLSALLRLMASARLVTLNAGVWSISETSSWNESGLAARWGALASGWAFSLSPQLHGALLKRTEWGGSLQDFLAWEFPIDSTKVRTESLEAVAQAAFLGLVVDVTRTNTGTAVVEGNTSLAVDTIGSMLPAYIDKILVQSDLTVISPGPLRPDLESKLRMLASVESRSVASTYRLSPVLIARAMDAGHDAEWITSFLSEVSSTGIPQPVAYLIADVGSKHASIRVRADHGSSLITCSDASAAARLLADVSLRALVLTAETENSLRSPHDVSVVMRNLHNEKYPAALESDTGEIQPWEPGPATVTGTTQAVNAITALLERLNSLATPDGPSDEQWLVRQIELAIRNKTLVNVTVSLPDGTARDFLIDPRGLSNGRFRGLDRKSQVERTLPLSSITAISNADVA